APDGVRHAFTSFFQFGVFDKFPRLKVVVLESGAGWIGYWLERMDAVCASPLGRNVPLREKPSFYFRRQCWISCDPDGRRPGGVTAGPVALTIAGSDPSGGAGIQADLRTFAAFGVHGASVLTALTAQDTRGVRAIAEVAPAFVGQQLDAVLDDLPVRGR